MKSWEKIIMIYQQETQSLLAILEQGSENPWQKLWHFTSSNLSYNMLQISLYGMNSVHLQINTDCMHSMMSLPALY